MRTLSVQVVHVDHYQWAGDPVIRVFGSNQRGDTTLLHIHQIYPYFYFRPHSVTSSSFEDISPEQRKHYATEIRTNLEDGIHKRKSGSPKVHPEKKAVHEVKFVEKLSMYGFQPDPQVFVQVWLRNPSDIKRAVATLEEGEVLRQQMQTFESHVPYLLQFFLDYDIVGMGWLHFWEGSAAYRLPRIDVMSPSEPRLMGSRPFLDRDRESAAGEQQLPSTPLQERDEGDQTEYYPTGDTLVDSSIGSQNEVCSGNFCESSLLYQDVPSKTQENRDVSLREINHLDGFAYDDIYTQGVLANQGKTNISALNKANSSEASSIFDRTATCDIECDLMGCDILNGSNSSAQNLKSLDSIKEDERTPLDSFRQESPGLESDCASGSAGSSNADGLSCVRSLKEIWEEERIRRKNRNISTILGEINTPPATQTRHRPMLQSEIDFASRFKRLCMKGRDLFGRTPSTSSSNQAKSLVNSIIIQSQSDVHENAMETPEVHSSDPMATILSQYNIADSDKLHSSTCPGGEVYRNLQNDFVRLSGHLPEDFDEIEEQNGSNWYSQSAKLMVDDIQNIQSDNADIVLTNRSMYEATQPIEDDGVKTEAMQENTSSGAISVPVLSKPRPKKRPGVIRSSLKPPLPSKSGNVSRSEHSTVVVSGVLQSEDFGLIDMIDKKHRKMKDQERKRKKVGFVSDSSAVPICSNILTPSPSKESTPGYQRSTPSSWSPADLSPGVRAFSRYASGSLLVLKPSFRPPHFSVSFVESACAETRQEVPLLHQVPFYSEAKDKAIITKINSKSTCPDNRMGWRPCDLKHVEEIPPFGFPSTNKYSESDSIGTLESCISACISGSLLSSYRAHSESIRCLIPSFSPPSYATIQGESKNLNLTRNFSERGNFSSKMFKVANVLSWKDCKYVSPMKSQLATPTQTQPKKNFGMKVSRLGFNEEASKTMSGRTKSSENLRRNDNAPAEKLTSKLKTMSLELYASSTGQKLPNPKFNAIHLVFYILLTTISTADSADEIKEHGAVCMLPFRDSENADSSSSKMGFKKGYSLLRGSNIPSSTKIVMVSSEVELIETVISIVRKADPDFLLGYEVQKSSWGYLIERATNLMNNSLIPTPMDLLQLLSRVPSEKPSSRNEYDFYGQEHDSGLWITGRSVINVWRRMRSELKLSSYTMNSVSSHLLNKSFPSFSCQQLTRWFSKGKTIGMVVNYIYRQTNMNLLFIDKLDLIRRTAESARLYGIDFYSVLSRGSQYRVEAVMLRVAHRKGFIAMSPSRKEVARQAPMEVIPLVLEPLSNFYVDPVVVLDFQSLYPSMIIAYNLCFSTIMGKLKQGNANTSSETTGSLGAMSYPEELSAYSVHCADQASAEEPYIAPNGSIFCPKSVRHGILPLMLKEILETRLMVKRSMKLYKGDEDDILHRVLDARQLALKLIANVTYGYTAAGFSGRMPMAELADAIVQCGRTTLEWVISEVESHASWKAKVVYGDTDSVFVHLKGRTKEEAFAIGADIAQEITRKSPADVLLKMEKVYLPSVLVSKKRYVGYAFENSDPNSNEVPHFDAKGIEVVRRDQCRATVKIQEKALRILFQTKDLSLVKAYLYNQWNKIHEGGDQIPLTDFIFQKEVKLGHYATDHSGQPRSLPPGAIVATEAMKSDPRAEPPYRWRVPYVVVSGSANARLKDLVVPPVKVLRRGSILRVNFSYYITKHINPALDRVLNFAGVDVSHWYRCMRHPPPKIKPPLTADIIRVINGHQKENQANMKRDVPNQRAITDFMASSSCIVCGTEETPRFNRDGAEYSSITFLCSQCKQDPCGALSTLYSRLKIVDDKALDLQQICAHCTGSFHSSQYEVVLFEHATHGTTKKEGQGILGQDGCLALDCPTLLARCQYASRGEDLRLSLAQISKNIDENEDSMSW